MQLIFWRRGGWLYLSCTLKPCSTHLLALIISLCGFLRIFYAETRVIVKEIWFCVSLSKLDATFYFSHQIVGRNLQYNVKAEREEGHSCPVRHLRGRVLGLSPSVGGLRLAVSFSSMLFLSVKDISHSFYWWRVFIMNGCWILSHAFPASIETIVWLLSFIC